MHGIGRLGAVASAFVGAYFLSLGWGASKIFLVLCIPPIGIIIALLIIKMLYSPKKMEQRELDNVQA